MEFLTNTNIDFLGYRKFFVWVSVAFLLVAFVELSPLLGGIGINFGIDFAGGTQLTVAFKDEVAIDDLRGTLEGAGLDVQLQRYGDEGSHEVLIKAPVLEGSEEGTSEQIIAALNAARNSDQSGGFDLNQRGTQALASLLFDNDPDVLRGGDEEEARMRYETIAETILETRNDLTLFRDFSDLDAVADVSSATHDLLERETFLGGFHVLQIENVGPQIGSELRKKGIWAVVLSLVGMLGYIWIRFELRFGVGAVVAVFHDFLITLGLFALFNYELNLSTIAAFLTLVGYSVNDTVVIFDRVRENMRRYRRKPLIDVMNESINQTLSRTVLTSGTTLIVIICLYVLGGDVIRGFAFVLLVGIIVGTYSSVFVASPFALLWEQHFGADAKAGGRQPSEA